MSRPVGLVGCVKSKGDQPAAAKDLYLSTLFQGRRRWVERHCSRWFVISAEHGLVAPERVLTPYDFTLKGEPVRMKRAWAERVLGQIDQELGPVDGLTIEVHAGTDYLDFGLVTGLNYRGARVVNPAQGLSLGRQLQFYQREDA